MVSENGQQPAPGQQVTLSQEQVFNHIKRLETDLAAYRAAFAYRDIEVAELQGQIARLRQEVESLQSGVSG